MSSSKTHKEFRDSVMDLLQTGGSIPSSAEGDVMIYPTFQQEALNLISDYSAIRDVLKTAANFPLTDLYLTSGYVNFPRELIDTLSNYPNEMKFLFAAPQANSFFHDPSFASIIPALYNIVSSVSAVDHSSNATSSTSARTTRRRRTCKGGNVV